MAAAAAGIQLSMTGPLAPTSRFLCRWLSGGALQHQVSATPHRRLRLGTARNGCCLGRSDLHAERNHRLACPDTPHGTRHPSLRTYKVTLRRGRLPRMQGRMHTNARDCLSVLSTPGLGTDNDERMRGGLVGAVQPVADRTLTDTRPLTSTYLYLNSRSQPCPLPGMRPRSEDARHGSCR